MATIYTPNTGLVRGVQHFYTATKPTVRPNGSPLVIGDKWWKTDDGTEWFWNGTYWVGSLQQAFTQPVQQISETTVGFPFILPSYSQVLISYYKVYFYLNPNPLSDTNYHVLRLYKATLPLYDLLIKVGDHGTTLDFVTKTTPILNIVTTPDYLMCSFRYDAGNGTPPTIGSQPIPISLFYRGIVP